MTQAEQLRAPPGAVLKIVEMYMEVDVRHIVAAIGVPTLVMHARGDRVVNVRHGRWLAEHIPGAQYVELEGIDHSVMYTNPDPVIDEVQEFLTGVRPVAEPDRVLATVMFTDIVGSTTKAADLGDSRWREVLEGQQRVVRGELERFRGREVKSTGDGFLATFDGPARAARCGQAIVGAVRPLGIEVRVGLHSGEVELMGDDVGGIAVHIASRVGSLAGAGEVLVSETVKGLVAGSGIAFEERGEHELKGIPDRWRLFSVK
jgi:class 3 adenylate cyclase